MKYTTKAVKAEIKRIEERAAVALEALAEGLRKERVEPACRRIGGAFYSGNGTFSFYDCSGHLIDDDDLARFGLVPLWETLLCRIGNNHCVGDYVNPVPQEGDRS